MVINIKIILLLSVLFLFSCKKAHERVCFKSKGEEAALDVSFDKDIDSLFLYDDLFYTLIQGEESKITLTGGENLLEHIEVISENRKLTVRNKNKCNFLRSFKNKIHAIIYVDSVRSIHYEGSGQLHSQDTLFSNELRLSITDGAGDVNLTLKNGYTSAVITHGFGNFTLKGKTTYAFLYCNTNSYCDTRNFTAKNITAIRSNTVADMLINANTQKLDAIIEQKGNIKYIGTPVVKSLQRTGKGELIDLNN